MCEHEWRNWPYSRDVLCLKCNYQIIGGKHYPWGNPKWTVPQPKTVEIEHEGVCYVVPKKVEALVRKQLASA